MVSASTFTRVEEEFLHMTGEKLVAVLSGLLQEEASWHYCTRQRSVLQRICGQGFTPTVEHIHTKPEYFLGTWRFGCLQFKLLQPVDRRELAGFTRWESLVQCGLEGRILNALAAFGYKRQFTDEDGITWMWTRKEEADERAG